MSLQKEKNVIELKCWTEEGANTCCGFKAVNLLTAFAADQYGKTFNLMIPQTTQKPTVQIDFVSASLFHWLFHSFWQQTSWEKREESFTRKKNIQYLC